MTVTLSDNTELLIVDSDTHRSEPWDLWTSRAPSKYKDRVPQVREIDGVGYWFFDGVQIGPAGAVCVVDRDMKKHVGMDFLFDQKNRVDTVAAAASEVGPRLEMMDEQGIWAQIVYPNAVGFGGQQIGQIADLDLRNAVTTMFNDASAEFQNESGNRLFPMAVLPWWDIDLSVKEVYRAKELGLVGANMLADPQEAGMTDLATPPWTPLFKALEETGMPLNFHIGASATQMNYHGNSPWPSLSIEPKLAVGTTMLFLSNARVLGNFIFGGIFERHPDLKFVSVESGIGWLPFTLQAMDYQMQETAPTSKLSLTPTEYFRRQCAGCFWFENELLVDSIEYIGQDNALFESDFPHPTCLYPSPVERALKAFDGQSDELKTKVFGGNAARIYNLPLPSGSK
jgi:predicted TIM-barrel fold metal-dependent hydrolase